MDQERSLSRTMRVLLYWQRYCTALEQWASAKVYGVVQGMELRNFRRGRHLYSAGRPSRWASAHILVKHNVPTAASLQLIDLGRYCFKCDIVV